MEFSYKYLTGTEENISAANESADEDTNLSVCRSAVCLLRGKFCTKFLVLKQYDHQLDYCFTDWALEQLQKPDCFIGKFCSVTRLIFDLNWLISKIVTYGVRTIRKRPYRL